MIKHFNIMRSFFIILYLILNSNVQSQSQSSENIIPGQYIVIIKESNAVPVVKSGLNTSRSTNQPNKELRDQNINKLKAIQNRQRLSSSSVLFEYADAIVGFSARLSDTEVQALRNDPAVEGVYPNIRIQLEQTSGNFKNENKIFSQVEDCAVTTSGGHTDGTSKFTWIWIMDTGIDTDHPDLNVQSYSPYAAFFDGSSIEDFHGHGTHVAGIAAAKDNDIGVVGVSAGAKVVPVKVFADNGIGSLSTLIAGINHISQYSISGDVVNMSLAYPESCNQQIALANAIINLANAGVWICVAAGNSSYNTGFVFPACLNSPRVVTVAAIDCQNQCASFTNLGSSVDWYAVGVDVYSTYKDGGYSTISGTSMATPVVAGIIHSRAQAPVRGPDITCQNNAAGITTKPLAKRQ